MLLPIQPNWAACAVTTDQLWHDARHDAMVIYSESRANGVAGSFPVLIEITMNHNGFGVLLYERRVFMPILGVLVVALNPLFRVVPECKPSHTTDFFCRSHYRRRRCADENERLRSRRGESAVAD